MTNYRVNLAFSEASFEMIIVITPEKEADPYNGQFSFDYTIATEKKMATRGPVSHNETIYFGIFFNVTNTAIYGERFPVATISRKSSCLSQRSGTLSQFVTAINEYSGCQWFPYDPNDQWKFFSSESRPSTEQLVR